MLYVAFDGNYGDSDGMVVVDNDDFDDHFYQYLDYCSDWQRPSFAEWFEKNNHELVPENGVEWSCDTCEDWINDVQY